MTDRKATNSTWVARCVRISLALSVVLSASCGSAPRITETSTSAASSWPKIRDELTGQFDTALEAGDEKSFCASLVDNLLPEFETCLLSTIGGEAVLLLRVVTACGGDSCDVAAWIRRDNADRFTAVDIEAGGTVEATPDGRNLLFDFITDLALPYAPEDATCPFGTHSKVITRRLNLQTGEVSAFSPCFSPRLSPGHRWIVCRNDAADVLRVSLDGGIPEPVATSGLNPEQVVFFPYSWQWPDAVTFPQKDRLRFSVQRAGGDSPSEETIIWQE